MSAFWVLARLRVLDVLRHRTSFGFFMVMPVVILIATAMVFVNGHPFEKRTVVVVDAENSDAASLAALEVLSADGSLRVEHVSQLREALGRVRTQSASVVLVFEADRVTLLAPRQEHVFARGLSLAFAQAPELRTLEVPRFGYVHYLFPGLLMFTVLLSGLFGTGYTMVLYRQNRVLKKLATTPLSKSTFVLAQIAARLVLVMAQVALLVLTMALGLYMPMSVSATLWTFAICALALLTFLGLGFTLACVIRTESLVVDLISAVSFPLILLSEMFFPLRSLPVPLAAIGAALPSTQTVRLLRSVLLYENTELSSLAPGLSVLFVWTALSFALSLKAFRWHA
jgi:ABC-2 type transport system permease protein